MDEKLMKILEYGNSIGIDGIMSFFNDEFHMVYRVNINSGEYEIILNNHANPEIDTVFESFFEVEENYKKNGIEEEYIQGLPGEKTDNEVSIDTIKISTVRKYFETNRKPLNGYYKKNNGKWFKLIVTPEKNYSDEYPYVIYAVSECGKEINEKTHNIIYSSAISKMYCLVVTVDTENNKYSCIHGNKGLGVKCGSGNLKDFMNIMEQRIYEEDFEVFKNLIYDFSTDNGGFLEREYRVEDKDGMFHFHNAFATYIAVPEGSRVLLLVRNVDERAANRATILSLNEEYEKAKDVLYALGNSYFGVYYLDIDKSHIITFRQGEDVKDVFNNAVDYERIMDKYVSRLVYPEDRSMVRAFSDIKNIASVLKKEGQRIFCEYQRIFDDEYRWIRLEYQAVKCVNGVPVRVIMAFKDIHDEREIELKHKRELSEAVISAKLASEAKSRFLSNMSHDMRTPMNAIMGMTSIALSHMEDKNKVKNCLDKINVSANHLLRLINEVLDMSYIESGKITLKTEVFNLVELIDTIVLIMQEQFDTRKQFFNMDVSGIKDVELLGDRVRIQQILINILGNASKYTPSGGKITFTATQKSEESNGDKIYVFTISDTGKGMSEEFIQKIFKPFEREEKVEEEIEGTGLGMAISKSITDLMNGNIQIESCINKGTIVTVTIPLKCSSVLPDTVEADDEEDEIDKYAVLKGKKVLVVDDNEINRDIACDYLEDVGVITEAANNGKEAYDIIASEKYFDAVLMDIRMPVMNGYDATRNIRGLDSEYAHNVPIIAMTANAFDEDVQMSIQTGMNDHISKPLNADTMYKALSKVFVVQ